MGETVLADYLLLTAEMKDMFGRKSKRAGINRQLRHLEPLLKKKNLVTQLLDKIAIKQGNVTCPIEY